MSKPKKRRRSRATMRSELPKGAYRTPDGGYITESRYGPTRFGGVESGWGYLIVRAKVRAHPDWKRLAQALVDLALEEIGAQNPEGARAAAEALAAARARHDGLRPHHRVRDDFQ